MRVYIFHIFEVSMQNDLDKQKMRERCTILGRVCFLRSYFQASGSAPRSRHGRSFAPKEGDISVAATSDIWRRPPFVAEGELKPAFEGIPPSRYSKRLPGWYACASNRGTRQWPCADPLLFPAPNSRVGATALS